MFLPLGIPVASAQLHPVRSRRSYGREVVEHKRLSSLEALDDECEVDIATDWHRRRRRWTRGVHGVFTPWVEGISAECYVANGPANIGKVKPLLEIE